MAHATIHPVKSSSVRDVYKFGDGPVPVLQPGTMGWSAKDLEDPQIERLWEQGRYEILDGVLTVMPASFVRGTICAFRLVNQLRVYLDAKNIRWEFCSEADIQVNPVRRIRADFACVLGDDVARFKGLKFEIEETDWRDYALNIPPTLVIESVTKGHEVHDWQTKRRWYAEFGVRHYWIVDGYKRRLECLILQDRSYLPDTAGVDMETVSLASLPGLKIPLREIWGDDE